LREEKIVKYGIFDPFAIPVEERINIRKCFYGIKGIP